MTVYICDECKLEATAPNAIAQRWQGIGLVASCAEDQPIQTHHFCSSPCVATFFATRKVYGGGRPSDV